MTGLVKVLEGVPVISTLDVCKGFEVKHRAVMELIHKYNTEFQSIRSFPVLTVKTSGAAGGRPVSFCMLDEVQVTFLGTLLRNSTTVIPFKLKLSVEFHRIKKELTRLVSQNQNAEWLEQRKAGKITRVLTTGTVKEFTLYAKEQGSQNAEKYYITISKMENSALFLLEQQYKNLRDMLDIHQLSTVKSADQIVIKALRDGMDKGMHYKDIYKLAKARVETFAEVIGKTLIPSSQLQIEAPAKRGKGGE